MRRRWLVLSASILAAWGWAAAAHAAPKAGEPFLEPLFPTRTAPVDWPTEPGTRLEMAAFAAKYPAERRCWKVMVVGQSEQQWKQNLMGAYAVGDTVSFSAMIGDTQSEFFGSVKDGRDGGKWRAVISWMDETGEKVLAEDSSAVRLSCATCSGFWSMYFNIPTTARTGRHRLHLAYTHAKLGMDVQRDLFFQVTNDGSWAACPQLDAAKAKYPAVVVLQNGRPCAELGVAAYAGTQDTYMISVHNVPDRRADHCNFGGLVKLQVGQYGQDLRGLIAFDLAKVPAEAEVAEAHLQMMAWQFCGRVREGATTQVQAYEVLKPWAAGVGDGSRYSKPVIRDGEASWQCGSFPTQWSEWGCGSPGVDRSAEPAGASEKTGVKSWVTVPLDKAMVQRWVTDARSNHGVLLTATGYAGNYHSSEYEDPAVRPRLILAFAKPLKAEPPVCSPDGTCAPPAAPPPAPAR